MRVKLQKTAVTAMFLSQRTNLKGFIIKTVVTNCGLKKFNRKNTFDDKSLTYCNVQNDFLDVVTALHGAFLWSVFC